MWLKQCYYNYERKKIQIDFNVGNINVWKILYINILNIVYSNKTYNWANQLKEKLSDLSFSTKFEMNWIHLIETKLKSNRYNSTQTSFLLNFISLVKSKIKYIK